VGDGLVVDVPHESAFDAVDPHVDDGRTRLDHVGRHEARLADGGDDDVGGADDRGEILRPAVADGDSGVASHPFLDQERRHRLADNFAAADDDGMGAGRRDTGIDQELLAAEGRTGHESGTSLREEPDVDGLKSVYVLERIDRIEDHGLVDLFGQRQLHEDAVHGRIGVQARDEFEELGLGGAGGEGVERTEHSGLFAAFAFAADVDGAGGIVADEDDGEVGGDAGGLFEGRDLRREFRSKSLRDSFAVDDACGHVVSP